MDVLYITGANLTKNTSANMSHNAFVQGLLDNGCNVQIIMESDSWGNKDSVLRCFGSIKYHEYQSLSFIERIKQRISYESSKDVNSNIFINEDELSTKISIKNKIRNLLKKIFYYFKKDKLYPLDETWIKKASRFKSDKKYDLIVSNSSPAASHKLADLLIRNRKIKTNRWIQIWEDPWYYDLYGGHTLVEKEEEHFLLRQASEVYYVSPLTLMYQKKYFADCADKMKCVTLPFFEYEEQGAEKPIQGSFGYFGDYYSVTRNLEPFYNALKESEYKGFIYGDNDLCLRPTENIEVSGRVTLDVLSEIQRQTEVLVHLSNLKGGQIPGKIYHYSATRKPILFILDGTEDEKRELFRFFSKFDRYYFCENNEEDIFSTMRKIINERKVFEPIKEFSPKEIVRKIIDEEEIVVH